MTRLVAFGCSCTYGYGLPDCFTPPDVPGTIPSKFAWPSLVAEKLNLECDNTSRPGASNFEILDNILNYQFEESDTVVVMWSFHERDMLFENNLERTYLHIGNVGELAEKWLSIHSDADFRMRSWFNMYTAYLHLSSLNVKFYFLNLLFDQRFHDLRPKWSEKITFLKPNLNYLSKQYPKALDNKHPGLIPHMLVAKRILEEIRNNE